MPELNNKKISYGNLGTFADELAKKYARKGELPAKVSDLTNDAGYQTGEQVDEKINAKVSSVYKPGGSVAFANLPELTGTNLGLVVNVADEFTTTDDFLEGVGQKHPAGTNVAVVQSGGEYKFDVLAGFVDLSGYVRIEDIEPLSEEEIRALLADKDSSE